MIFGGGLGLKTEEKHGMAKGYFMGYFSLDWTLLFTLSWLIKTLVDFITNLGPGLSNFKYVLLIGRLRC